MNEEIAVHEWQQKVKDVMKELSSLKDVNVYFVRLKKPREQLCFFEKFLHNLASFPHNRHFLLHDIAEYVRIILYFFLHPIRWPDERYRGTLHHRQIICVWCI